MARRNRPVPAFTVAAGIGIVVSGVVFYVGLSYYSKVTFAGLGEISRSSAEFSNMMTTAVALFIVLMGCVDICIGIYRGKKERAVREKIWGLTSEGGVSPRELLDACDVLRTRGDFTGVYVIHNKTKDMYYVGQSARVVGRLIQHLTGCGNGDVYADYKYGDDFELNVVSLRESGYDSLDALERDTIAAYDAYGRGYNCTRGNKN